MNRPFLPKAEEITHGLIVSGGPVDLTFAAGFLKNRSYELVIAVDAGLDTCLKLGLTPDLAVGDFDTFGRERMEALIRRLRRAVRMRTFWEPRADGWTMNCLISSFYTRGKGAGFPWSFMMPKTVSICWTAQTAV